MQGLTLDTIAEITGGKISRDGESVTVGYGPLGFYRLRPDSIIRDNREIPAVQIQGKLSKQDGGHHKKLRDTIRAAGYEVR